MIGDEHSGLQQVGLYTVKRAVFHILPIDRVATPVACAVDDYRIW